MADATLIQVRDRAEIERSSIEATLTPDSALRMSRRTLTRYERPPANTAFPLEYSYHLLGDVHGKRIVDFGCGSGANAVLLANRGARVCGVDISEDLIRLAERRLAANGRAGAVRFLVGSAHDLPFPDGSIDVVFGVAILHHSICRSSRRRCTASFVAAAGRSFRSRSGIPPRCGSSVRSCRIARRTFRRSSGR